MTKGEELWSKLTEEQREEHQERIIKALNNKPMYAKATVDGVTYFVTSGGYCRESGDYSPDAKEDPDHLKELEELFAQQPNSELWELVDMHESGHRTESWTRVYTSNYYSFDVSFERDAKLIVALRNHVPELLKELKRLREFHARITKKHPTPQHGLGSVSVADLRLRSELEHLSAGEANSWTQAADVLEAMEERACRAEGELEKLRAGK